MLKSFAAMARFARNRPNDPLHLTGTWIRYKKQRRRRQLGLGKAVVWGTTIVAFCCLWLPIVSGIDERVHLLKLYEATNGPAWKRSANWNSDDSVCSWFGITCEPIDGVDVVIKIELHRNNLNGKVAPELWKLPHLKHIDMRNNLLTSASFEGLKASGDSNSTSPIEVILLSENHLTDLNGIGNAKATLRELNANRNQIDDNLSPDVFDCTNLELLHFSFNQITGTLPTRIGMLTKLTEFYASDNRISGQLPKEIGMLNVCQVFALGNNLLSGTLPTELDNMVNVRELSLHKNTGITGSLLSLGDMPYLEFLTLEGNSLSGSIPSDFLRHNNNTPKPVTIDLSHNNITGTLPKSLERFETLSIDLVGNMIEEIPTELCEKGGWMGGLVEQFGCNAILCGKDTYNREGRADDKGDCISCKDNYPYLGATACSSATQEPWEVLADFYEGMSGYKWTTNDGWNIFADASANVSNAQICDSFYGVGCDGDQISNISLPDNELFGAVPDCIFSLSSLQMLDLSNNNIQLTDMRGTGRAHALKSLKLSNVKIKSLDGIGNLTSLEELYLDGLSIVEPLHYEIFQLTKLKILDLQHSKFEGALPTLIRQLSHLER
jgi:Leucine-rich repeat (LRR) protein